MPTYAKYNGKLMSFTSEAERDSFLARQNGIQQTQQETAVLDQTPVEPVQASAMLPPSEPMKMVKGGRARLIPAENIGRAQQQGWTQMTSEQEAALRDMEEARKPFGRSVLGEVGNSLVTGAEEAASTLLIPSGIVGGLLEDGSPATGHEVYARFKARAMQAFGSDISEAKVARNMRYRAQENSISAFIGGQAPLVAASIATGGAATAALAPSLGRVGAAAAVGALEGGVTGGLAANEQAWIMDREATATDIVISAGFGALFGGTVSGGFAGAGAAARWGKEVFGKRVKPGALAGQIADEAAVGATGEGNAFLDFVAGGRRGALRTQAREINLNLENFNRHVAKVEGQPLGASTQDLSQKWLTRYRTAKLSDGSNVYKAGSGANANVARAENILRWNDELSSTMEDLAMKSKGTTSVDDVLGRLDDAAQRGEFEVMAETKDAIAAYRDALGERMRETGRSQLSATDLMAVRRNLIQHAQNNPALARAGDVIEDSIESALEGMGKEFRDVLTTRKVARALVPGAEDTLAAMGELTTTPTLTEAGARFALGSAQRLSGLHTLAGAGNQVGAVRDAIAAARQRVIASYSGRRYLQGGIVMEESMDSAVLSLLGKGKDFATSKLKFKGLTGGVVPDAIGKGIVTGPGAALAKFYGNEDYGEALSREAANERFQRQRNMLQESANSIDGVLERYSANMGEAAELHPQLTMEVAGGAIALMGYLNEALPRGTPLSPAMPNGPQLPPSRADMASYDRKFRTALNPYSALDDLGNGRLHKDSVEALSRAHPVFYQRLTERMLNYVGSYPGRLPTSTARQIETLLQQPGLLTPTTGARFQASYNMAVQAAAASQAGGMPSGPSAPGGGRPSGAPTLGQQMRSPVSNAIDNIHNE